MNDKIKLELKPQTIDGNGETRHNLGDLRAELKNIEAQLKQKKTLQEAQAFLANTPISKDYTNHYLQVGNVIVRAKDDEELAGFITTIEADLASANEKLALIEYQKAAEEKVVVDKAKEEEKLPLIQLMQKLADEKKQMKLQYQQFLVTNAPADAQADLEKMFSLAETVDAAQISNQALLTSTITANAIAGMKEENEYLRRQVTGYETKGAKYKLEKFKPSNKHIADDLEKIIATFGTPEQKAAFARMTEKPADAPTNTPENKTTTSTEKPIEQMTSVEKQDKMKEIMQLLKSSLKISKETVDGQTYDVVNLTTAQYERLQHVNKLGGPGAGLGAIGVQPTGLDRRIQKNLERGNDRRVNKLLRKQNKYLKEMAEDAKENNALSQQNAEMKNRIAFDRSTAIGVNEISKDGMYQDGTVEVVPYVRLFTDICANVNTELATRGYAQLQSGPNGPILIRCPDRMRSGANTYAHNTARTHEPDLYRSCQTSGKGIFGGDNFLTGLLEKTNMTPEQAKKTSSILFAGTGLFLAWRTIAWLTGKDFIPKKGSNKFLTRAGTLLGIGFGLDVASKAANGRGIFKNIGEMLSGNMKWSEWISSHSSPETKSYLPIDCACNSLRSIPLSVLCTCCTEKSDGNPKIDVAKLDALLTQMIATETDPDKKRQLQGQLDFVKNIKNDPASQDYIDRALASWGYTYEGMKKSSPAETIDTKAQETRERQTALAKYCTDNKLKVKDHADTEVVSYIWTGSPTLDELKSKGKLVADNVDAANPTTSPENLDPNAKLDTALHTVDLPLATQLQAAKEKLMNGKAIEAKYRMIDGKLNVESYGMYTPLQYKGNKWYVGGFSDRADPVSNIPIGFEKAEQAVWVANLTNRLIALETGKHSVNRPFSAANYLNNATLRVGDSPSLFEWFKDKRAVDGGRFKSTSTLREYGGDTFQTNIGAYANYLNGLTHANGESIWSTKGQIRGSGDITNWLDQVEKIPARKAIDNARNNPTTTIDLSTEAGRKEALEKYLKDNKLQKKDLSEADVTIFIINNNITIEQLVVDLKTKGKLVEQAPTDNKEVLHDNNMELSEFSEAVRKKGDELYIKFNGLDGGGKDGTFKRPRNPRFFYMRAKSLQDGQKVFTVDAYDRNGVLKGIDYERKSLDEAPRRINVVPPYGYKEKVNKQGE